jgi:hypothetical protein
MERRAADAGVRIVAREPELAALDEFLLQAQPGSLAEVALRQLALGGRSRGDGTGGDDRRPHGEDGDHPGERPRVRRASGRFASTRATDSD